MTQKLSQGNKTEAISLQNMNVHSVPAGSVYMLLSAVVGFSSHARICGGCLTIHSLPVCFFVLFFL